MILRESYGIQRRIGDLEQVVKHIELKVLQLLRMNKTDEANKLDAELQRQKNRIAVLQEEKKEALATEKLIAKSYNML